MLDNINTFKAIENEAVNSRLQTGGLTNGKVEKLNKAAGEFEALFIYHMLKTMRQNPMKTNLLDGGKGEEIYTSMLDQEMSTIMSSGEGIGLKKSLIQQLLNEADFKQGSAVAPGTADFSAPINKVNAIKQFESHLREEDFTSPVAGTISSGYGIRKDPFTSKHTFHHGIDIAAMAGSQVHPSKSGEVIFSGKMRGYGNLVEVRHANGYVSRYAHNKENLVSVGDMVNPSDVISLVGSSGASTDPHLHFEIRVEDYAINPVDLVDFG